MTNDLTPFFGDPIDTPDGHKWTGYTDPNAIADAVVARFMSLPSEMGDALIRVRATEVRWNLNTRSWQSTLPELWLKWNPETRTLFMEWWVDRQRVGTTVLVAPRKGTQ